MAFREAFRRPIAWRKMLAYAEAREEGMVSLLPIELPRFGILVLRRLRARTSLPVYPERGSESKYTGVRMRAVEQDWVPGDRLATATPLTGLFATEEDARRLARTSMTCNGAALAHLLLAAGGWVPAWTLLLSVPVLVPRWMIAVHELFHLRDGRDVDVWTRFMPFPFTFLSLGYRELLANHQSHHRCMCTPADAEYFQLRGSRLQGVLNAFSAPEQMWFRWVAKQGIDRQLMLGTLVRLALIGTLIGVCGANFLWYWVPARLAFGASFFSFFYGLHRRGPAFGVYPIQISEALARLATLVWGHDVVQATLHHDVHHAQPRIAARFLARARPLVILTSTG